MAGKNFDPSAVTIYIDDSDDFDEVVLNLKYSIDQARLNCMRLDRLLSQYKLISSRKFDSSATDTAKTLTTTTKTNTDAKDVRVETVVAEISSKNTSKQLFVDNNKKKETPSQQDFIRRSYSKLNEIQIYRYVDLTDEQQKKEHPLSSDGGGRSDENRIEELNNAIASHPAVAKTDQEDVRRLISSEEIPNSTASAVENIPLQVFSTETTPQINEGRQETQLTTGGTRNMEENNNIRRSLTSLLRYYRWELDNDLNFCQATFWEMCAISFLTASLLTSVVFLFLVLYKHYDIRVVW